MTLGRTFRETLGPYWPHVWGVVALRAVSGLCEVVGLIYLVHIVGSHFDRLPHGNLARVIQLEALVLGGQPSAAHQVVLFLLLTGTAVVLKHAGRVWLGVTVVKVEHRVRSRMVECSIGLAWERFISMRLGQFHESVLGRSQQGVYAVQACIDFLADIVAGALFLAVSFSLSPLVTLVLCAFFAGVAFVFTSLKTRSGEYLRKIPVYIRRLTRDLEGIVNSLKYLKEAGLTDYARDRYMKSLENHSHAHRHLYFFRTIPEGLLDITSTLVLGALLFCTFVFGWLEFTVAVTFLAIFYRLAPRIQLAFSHYLHMKAREPLLRDLNKLLAQMERYRDRPRGKRRVTLSREVRFDNVSFHYRRAGSPFELGGINLTLEWGKCVALVGTSGGGKSTFVDLLCGLFPPKGGRVLVDGTDLEEIDPTFWGRQIGLVLQSTPVVHATLLENVTLGERRVDEKWAETCLRMANLGTLLDEDGMNLYTVVGQQGYRLSGGQQQRVALARALYRRPRLLVLDEATSSLDSHTEEQFQEELERLRGRMSIVIVAHRLKTVRMADEILVVENGKIEQRGSWRDLLGDPAGRFHQLAERQGLVPRNPAMDAYSL